MNETLNKQNQQRGPGQSGNPKGGPIGARQKISEQLLADLAVVWEHQGESVLRRLAIEDPGKLAQIAYVLLPRRRLHLGGTRGRRATGP